MSQEKITRARLSEDGAVLVEQPDGSWCKAEGKTDWDRLAAMSDDWTIDEGEAGRGEITHLAAPRFTAQWTSGAAELAGIDGPCWTAEGGDEDDALHIFGFSWTDPAPDQAGFERLMRQAAAAIDDWISGQM